MVRVPQGRFAKIPGFGTVVKASTVTSTDVVYGEDLRVVPYR